MQEEPREPDDYYVALERQNEKYREVIKGMLSEVSEDLHYFEGINQELYDLAQKRYSLLLRVLRTIRTYQQK